MKIIISDPCDEVEHIYKRIVDKIENVFIRFDDFKCDRCSKDLNVHEVGYMGDPNEGYGCNEFTTIVTLCKRCTNQVNDY